MFSVGRVILWELWRLSRLELLMRIGYSIAGAGLMAAIASGQLTSTNEKAPPAFFSSVALLILCCSGLFSASWFRFDANASNLDFHLSYTRPVSTRQLALVHLAFFVITSALCFLLPALLFERISGIDLNLQSPLIVICVFVVCATNAVWMSSSLPARITGCVAVCISFISAIVVVLSSRMTDEPLLFSLGRPEFTTVEPYQIFLLVIASVVMTFVGLRAVEAQRHGERLRFGWQLTDPPIAHQPLSGRTVALNSQMVSASRVSPWKARLWRHWRQGGKAILMVAAVLTIAVTVLQTSGQMLYPRAKGIPAFWLGTLILSPVIYQMIAAEQLHGLKRRRGITELSVFDAVQPVRDDTAVATNLVLTAVLSGLGWMMTAVAATLQTFWSGKFAFWQNIGEELGQQFSHLEWYKLTHIVAGLLALFIVSSAAMLSIGLVMGLVKDRYYFAFSGLFACLYLIGTFDLIQKLELDWFWTSVQVCLGVTTAGACAFGIWQCIVRRAIGLNYGIFVSVMSLTAITGLGRIVFRAMEFMPVPLSTIQIVLGTANVVVGIVAALCIPPLALNLHRHG
ncbi:MAG: hypothetical protein ABGZ53_07300 [Fuerstiella sp.]